MFFDKKKSKYALVKAYDPMDGGAMFIEVIEYDWTELNNINTVVFHLKGKNDKCVPYTYILGMNYPTIENAERAREQMIEESSGCSCHCECDVEDDGVMYVVTGEYPNLSISAKYVEAEDEFNFCFSEQDTDNLSLHPKDRCFDTYEQANNKVIELIQKGVEDGKSNGRKTNVR